MGGTFKVSVPVKPPDDAKDGNKFPRNLQEVLDVFGKAYDEWCTAQSKIDSSFQTFKEKQGKFDRLAKVFPTNLITKVDATYIKQVVRRARQNKYKRTKTAAAKTEKETVKEEPDKEVEDEQVEEEEQVESEEEKEEPVAPPKKYRTVNIPTKGSTFVHSQGFSSDDFNI